MKKYAGIGMAVIIIVSILLYYYKDPSAQESITFFPIAPNVAFKSANTKLFIDNEQRNTLFWDVDSELDRKAYLRQDAGILYANGRLVDTLSKWKQNTNHLEQNKQINIDQSALFQAITFHQAELHEAENQIFSAQTMSADQLYVEKNGKDPFAFKTPKTPNEIDLKKQLDERTERMLQLSWNKGIRQYSVNLRNYEAYPLSLFNEKAKEALPGFQKEETARIIGNLWEGLYKNYLLGIKKADGSTETSIGSTLPLILIAKDKSHLLVLSQTAKGNPILLRQKIGAFD